VGVGVMMGAEVPSTPDRHDLVNSNGHDHPTESLANGNFGR